MLILGLAVLIVRAGELLTWIYLTIGISFGLYSLFRKLGPLGAMQGLAVETALLTVPVAVAWVFGCVSFGYELTSSTAQSVTLMLCGIVSVIPLWLFSFANRRLSLATLGFFQYTLPTTQFVLAILFYRQIPGVSTFAGLAIIWAALGLVVFESVFVGRRPSTVAT